MMQALPQIAGRSSQLPAYAGLNRSSQARGAFGRWLDKHVILNWIRFMSIAMASVEAIQIPLPHVGSVERVAAPRRATHRRRYRPAQRPGARRDRARTAPARGPRRGHRAGDRNAPPPRPRRACRDDQAALGRAHRRPRADRRLRRALSAPRRAGSGLRARADARARCARGTVRSDRALWDYIGATAESFTADSACGRATASGPAVATCAWWLGRVIARPTRC